MFEKDAEEHTKKNFCGCCPLTWKNQCKNFVNCGYHDSWKDGAEFGYNKANEWHKADVPTTPINKVVLGYIKDYNTKKFCLVKWNGEWWYDARTWNDKVKLIAWKEIVLPELPKESE